MEKARYLLLIFVSIACISGAPDDDQHALGNNSLCTVQVPELFPSFVSTHIDFLSPTHGSKHQVGARIPLNVAVAVLPSLPVGLSERLLLCLEVHKGTFRYCEIPTLPSSLRL